MARKKTKMAYITDDANRRRTFAKRKKGLLKKVSELSVLCGVPACALVTAPGDPNHDIWPSIVGADALISQLKDLPAPDQDKRSLDQEKYLARTVSRLRDQLRKVERENQEAEAKAEVLRCLCGVDDDARGARADVREACALVEGTARAVAERIQRVSGCPPAVVDEPPPPPPPPEVNNAWGGVGDVQICSTSSFAVAQTPQIREKNRCRRHARWRRRSHEFWSLVEVIASVEVVDAGGGGRMVGDGRHPVEMIAWVEVLMEWF